MTVSEDPDEWVCSHYQRKEFNTIGELAEHLGACYDGMQYEADPFGGMTVGEFRDKADAFFAPLLPSPACAEHSPIIVEENGRKRAMLSDLDERGPKGHLLWLDDRGYRR